MVQVLVLTSDKYLHLLPMFCYQFEKHWPGQKATFVGFTPPSLPLPDAFDFVSVGAFEDYPFKKWSDALIKFLSEYEHSHAVIMLEDYILSRDVDAEAIDMLWQYMIDDGRVVKVDLGTDRLYAKDCDLEYGMLGRLDLIKSDPTSAYHLSLMAGIWNVRTLLDVLVPDESPHDLEISGTSRLREHERNIVIGTRQWPLRHILAIRGLDMGTLDLSGLPESDLREMEDDGLIVTRP